VRRLILVLLILGAAGAGVWQWRETRPLPVSTAAAERGTAIEAVYATGTVEPVHAARIQSLAAARIVAVPVHEGQAVAEGQVVVQLDDAQLRARRDELAAQAEYRRHELERRERLLRTGASTQQQVERARSDLDMTEAAIRALDEQVADLALRSPLSGAVLRLDAEVGEVARTDAVLARVGRLRPLRIALEVDEEDIARVALGQEVLVHADAFPGDVLRARVAEITPRGDPQTKTYRVRAALPDDTPLMIGMTVEANVVVRRDPDALLVPARALAGGRVFVVEDGKAVARAVGLGALGTAVGLSGPVEVSSGLAEGERVVLDPPPGMESGRAVAVEATGEAGGARAATPVPPGSGTGPAR
jgi:RND family efflux transporter MFP subunit